MHSWPMPAYYTNFVVMCCAAGSTNVKLNF
jgi:hypothetical protein